MSTLEKINNLLNWSNWTVYIFLQISGVSQSTLLNVLTRNYAAFAIILSYFITRKGELVFLNEEQYEKLKKRLIITTNQNQVILKLLK